MFPNQTLDLISDNLGPIRPTRLLTFLVRLFLRMSSSEASYFKSWKEYVPSPSVKINKDPLVLKFCSEKSPSSSCSFKINNKDDDSLLTKYESSPFSSGGYNWRLVVYQKGNEEDNGKGFVSMYVELENSSSMDVFAYLSFFVFNKKDNKYLSFQDVEVKRFDSSNAVFGLSQVIPLETFSEYVLDGEGCCEFGAHVKVASPNFVDFNKNLPYHKFLWSFRDFSLLKQNDYVSISFSMKERKWNLKLYPKGDSRSCGGLSFYLHLDDLEVLSTGQMMFVRQDVRALDPRRSNHQTTWSRGWVMPSTRAEVFPLSITLEKLKENCVDNEDTLNVEIEIEVLNEIISPFLT